MKSMFQYVENIIMGLAMSNYFKLIVAGGRHFEDYTLLKAKLDIALKNVADNYDIVIISGEASGADTLGSMQ